MNSMKHRGYTARIDFDGNDQVFTGEVVGMREILTFTGLTVDELRTDFEFAVDHYLSACETAGVAPARQASGKLLVRMPPSVHIAAGVAAASAGVSLNEWIVGELRKALGS